MTPWWDKKYGKGKICGITHCRLRAGKQCIFLPCKHGFYKKALLQWVETGKNDCPMCRKKFEISVLFPKRLPLLFWGGRNYELGIPFVTLPIQEEVEFLPIEDILG